MDTFPHIFIRQLAGTVAAALMLVVMTAFLSIPYSLGGHPGKPRAIDATLDRHMS